MSCSKNIKFVGITISVSLTSFLAGFSGACYVLPDRQCRSTFNRTIEPAIKAEHQTAQQEQLMAIAHAFDTSSDNIASRDYQLEEIYLEETRLKSMLYSVRERDRPEPGYPLRSQIQFSRESFVHAESQLPAFVIKLSNLEMIPSFDSLREAEMILQ